MKNKKHIEFGIVDYSSFKFDILATMLLYSQSMTKFTMINQNWYYKDEYYIVNVIVARISNLKKHII